MKPIRLFLALLFLVVVTPPARALYDVVGIYLTWQRDPATTMTVNWVNLYPEGAATVWYRKMGEKEWASATGSQHVAAPSALQVRRVELTGLAPDTMYEFQYGERPPKVPAPAAAPTSTAESAAKIEDAEVEAAKGEKATSTAPAPVKARDAVSPAKPAVKEEEAVTEKEEKPAKPAVVPDTRSTYRFRTMPAELSRPIHFVAGGDMMHSREMVDAMNKRAGALEPDFALIGGDLAYANGADATRWIDWFQSWTKNARGKGGRLIPMVIGIGNHEVRGGYKGRIPEDAPYFYGFFALPENRSYYALDFGAYLSFVVLDSGHTQAISGAQATWLGEALAARRGQRFLFPMYHWPAYGTSKAEKGKLPSESKRSIEIRTQWIPHFERHGVTAVFENDHHNYKRTYPIRGHQRDDRTGLVYLGDGAWGVTTRTVPKDAWYLAKAEPRRHLFHVTLPPKGPVTVHAVDAKGVIFDKTSFALPRTAPTADR